jgi:putative addiction module killer protein
MTIRVEEYTRGDGSNPYRKWFDRLSVPAAQKVMKISTKLMLGNTSGLKPVGHGVAEWKVDWGAGLRVYVYQDGNTLILLLGGSDSKQKQQPAIDEAISLATEYKTRKKVDARRLANELRRAATDKGQKGRGAGKRH